MHDELLAALAQQTLRKALAAASAPVLTRTVVDRDADGRIVGSRRYRTMVTVQPETEEVVSTHDVAPLTRTVIDRDPVSGRIVGMHDEWLDSTPQEAT